jgi:hypothetical protein
MNMNRASKWKNVKQKDANYLIIHWVRKRGPDDYDGEQDGQEGKREQSNPFGEEFTLHQI